MGLHSWHSLVLPCSSTSRINWIDKKVEWYVKNQLQCQIGSNTLQDWNKNLQKTVFALNQCLIHDSVATIARTHKSSNQMMPLTITPNNPLSNVLLPLPMILCSADSKVLVPEEARNHKNSTIEPDVKTCP